MTTLRELEMGEELTFDYNAVTESLNEYRSAVCLCGYGKCRGSFLHFSTADCYQQVLNRNSPIAARMASLVKASMKQVMSQDDEKILRTHGFNTAAFGAISVIRREYGSGEEKTKLDDSMSTVPIWLRTYVADVLRYIEYERRALPIALLCDHLASSKDSDKVQGDGGSLGKEPKREPSFFFFSRTESSKLSKMLAEQGVPDSLKGLQRKHAMQKVASSFWGKLSEEKRLEWKERADEDFEKRLKAWNSNQANSKTAKPQNNKKKPGIEEILLSSKVSFQDADAEGFSAMEQRIQQLTQSLSRVGRVLDRHRESCFGKENSECIDSATESVRPPLRFLSENEVAAWIWEDRNGLVHSLIDAVSVCRCAREQLKTNLSIIRDEFLRTEALSKDSDKRDRDSLGSSSKSRAALLRVRECLLDDLKAMAKEIKRVRLVKSSTSSLSESRKTPTPSDVEDIGSDSNETQSIDRSSETLNLENQHLGDTERVGDGATPECKEWMSFYGERCALQAAADVVLFYAYTSTFFVLQPYTVLQSSPIEIYARELGNSVPKSAIEKEPPQSCKSKPEIGSELCAPDDIISYVSVQYQGEYVLSQLLQWYNAGIGLEPGLPGMLGCSLLPRVSDCWSSQLFDRTTAKADRKTVYENKIRRRIVEWMQDPFQRGSAWPEEISRAFVGKEMSSILEEPGETFIPFGSPILDFLVTGDESNITKILKTMDGENKIKQSDGSDGLLSSVDKGRPAQAVSTWVQCEKPDCQKWRKIPWYVDPDALPEHFFCSDNIWNESANSCEAPEDDWDSADALVGADGKVEGTPVKKHIEENLDVLKEESFTIGGEKI